MAEFQLTKQQEDAIKKTVAWYKNSTTEIFKICGYAGVGKSSIIRYMAGDLNIAEDKVAYITFTAKASLVLRRKGIPANTIHSTIYRRSVVYDTEGNPKVVWQLQPYLDFELFVIDEVSMVSRELLNDILSFGIPIITIGDPAQLPPVNGKNDFIDHPDVMLTEIHRQAKDDPIIRIATKIRQGETITKTDAAANVGIFTRNIEPEYLSKVGMVIVGTHKLRTGLNNTIRKHLGYDSPYFGAGEKVIFKMNNKNSAIVYDDMDVPICNGMIGYMRNDYDPVNNGMQWIKNDYLGVTKQIEYAKVDVRPEFAADKYYENIRIDLETLQTDNHKPVTGTVKDNINILNRGYAITGHSSQGSQWESVCVYDDFLFDEELNRRYLYTAVTRAEKKLLLKI